MFFLLKSEKWAPLRDYSFEAHGKQATTFVFGLLTTFMMPILFWLMRRGENGIQSCFGARTLASFHDSHFIESIVVIHQDGQIPFYHEELKNKVKVFFGLGLSKIYVFVLFGFIYGLDRIQSDEFRCRNLKDGAGFLLSNDTEPADYLNMTFSEISDLRRESGKDADWYFDQANGLHLDYFYDYLYVDYFYEVRVKFEFAQKFSQAADLIDSFNVLGFHEVCNVLYPADLATRFALPPWFGTRNATEYFIKIMINAFKYIFNIFLI